jgi:hypothetical protein
MQRTIKFRGKTKVGKEWVYGYVYETQIFIDGNPCQDVMIIDDFTVIPETVGQFTGLTDKNGKEIYEGDIVRYDDISDLAERLQDISEVEYINHKGCFEPLAIGYCSCYYMRYIENIEVIGNIHDNPELLGECK